MSIKQISAPKLKSLLGDESILFLDVRELNEYEFSRIEGSVLIPLNELPDYVHMLEVGQQIVLICHHGIRSQQAAGYLETQGFTDLSNLVGGVNAWAIECDPEMPRY
ncbi:MAG: rhodanese [Methylococcales bacterium]|nr:rhodanese [Methylococcales bacterium]